MLEDLVCRVALQWVDLEHEGDQLFGRVRDLVPVGRVEFEESTQDLLVTTYGRYSTFYFPLSISPTSDSVFNQTKRRFRLCSSGGK